MKIIPLSKDDAELLQAAHLACHDAERALDQAHKTNKAAKSAYNDLLEQLQDKHKLKGGGVSTDQRYLYGAAAEPEPVEEPKPEPEPAPVEPKPVVDERG